MPISSGFHEISILKNSIVYENNGKCWVAQESELRLCEENCLMQKSIQLRMINAIFCYQTTDCTCCLRVFEQNADR